MISRTGSRMRAYAPLVATLLLGSALGACNRGAAPEPAPSDSGSAAADLAPATLPLSTDGSASQTAAPPVTALPVTKPVALRRLADRRQGYGWLDQANYQEEAFADAPPDYAFDQDGVRPWTWASGDGSRVITEPVAGGYRTYYYEAGAQQPYMVRDPNYSYAYENGALVAVFTLAGALLDPDAASPQAIYASRYYDRGRTLWRDANSGQHVPVNAYAWSDRRSDFAAQRVAWQSHYADNPDWSAWNSAHGDAERSHWAEVRAQHQQAAQQFSGWQQQHFQGPPPQFYADQHRADGGQSGHAAAIAGAVMAGGVAATIAHAVHGHPSAPQPGVPPQAGRPPAITAQGRAPEYGHAAPPAGAPMPRHEAVTAAPHAPPHAFNHQEPRASPQPGMAPARAPMHEQARPVPAPEHQRPQEPARSAAPVEREPRPVARPAPSPAHEAPRAAVVPEHRAPPAPAHPAEPPRRPAPPAHEREDHHEK